MELASTTGDLEQAYKQSQNKLSSQAQALEEAEGQNQALKAALESSNKSLSDSTNQAQLLKQEYDEKIKMLEQGNQGLKNVAATSVAKIEELES